jgi:hypothetical protein
MSTQAVSENNCGCLVQKFVGNDYRTSVCIKREIERHASSRNCSRTVSGRRIRSASSSAIMWCRGGGNVGGGFQFDIFGQEMINQAS